MTTTGKRKPAVREHQPAGNGQGVTNVRSHHSTYTPLVNPPCDPRRDPVALAHAERAELARAAGDRAGYLEARRAYLLRQAELLAEVRA